MRKGRIKKTESATIDEAIKKHVADGLSYAQTAIELNVSTMTVLTRAHKMKLASVFALRRNNKKTLRDMQAANEQRKREIEAEAQQKLDAINQEQKIISKYIKRKEAVQSAKRDVAIAIKNTNIYLG